MSFYLFFLLLSAHELGVLLQEATDNEFHAHLNQLH